MVEISVIILTWNQKDLTIRCLNSLFKQIYKDYEVILVDNGSEDETVQAVKKEFGSKVKIVALKENKGFAGGNNEGVRNCSKESKYIMCLNNDTIVQPNLLSEAIKSIKSSKNIGAVSIAVLNKGLEQINKSMYTNNISATSNLFTDVISISINKKRINNYYFFGVCGTCFLYKKNILDLPFDDYYFAYSEDNYLGLKLRIMDYENIQCKSTYIFHENASVKSKASPAFKRHLVFLGRRNKILNQLLFFEKKTLFKLLPLLLLYHFFENIYDIKNIRIRINVYYDIMKNIKLIKQKRKEIQIIRNINDNKYLKLFSYKFIDETLFQNKLLKFIAIILNTISRFYCIIFKIKLMESSPDIIKKYGVVFK